jgi:hypothetical protein
MQHAPDRQAAKENDLAFGDPAIGKSADPLPPAKPKGGRQCAGGITAHIASEPICMSAAQVTAQPGSPA